LIGGFGVLNLKRLKLYDGTRGKKTVMSDKDRETVIGNVLFFNGFEVMHLTFVLNRIRV